MYNDLIKTDEIATSIHSVEDIIRFMKFLSNDLIQCQKIDGNYKSANCPGYVMKNSRHKRCFSCIKERRQIRDRKRKKKERKMKRKARKDKRYVSSLKLVRKSKRTEERLLKTVSV